MPERAPDFVYTVYIAAGIDAVWNGLIDKELTKAYWGHYNVSDWKAGSRWEHVRSDESGTVDIVGKVLEIDPPQKLVVSWSSPDDEGVDMKTSRVVYELQALGPDTKLVVTHADLEEGSDMHSGVTQGWPAVLSNLKTILETGRTLSDEAWTCS